MYSEQYVNSGELHGTAVNLGRCSDEDDDERHTGRAEQGRDANGRSRRLPRRPMARTHVAHASVTPNISDPAAATPQRRNTATSVVQHVVCAPSIQTRKFRKLSPLAAFDSFESSSAPLAIVSDHPATHILLTQLCVPTSTTSPPPPPSPTSPPSPPSPPSPSSPPSPPSPPHHLSTSPTLSTFPPLGLPRPRSSSSSCSRVPFSLHFQTLNFPFFFVFFVFFCPDFSPSPTPLRAER